MDRSGRSTVIGVFLDDSAANLAFQALRDAGFPEDNIGFVSRRGAGEDASLTQAGENTGEGLATGAVVGGLIGAAAALLIPGIGPVVAGGVLASVLGGAAVGAAAGGILGALVGMGIPEDEATYYEGEFQAGRTLITVKADGRFDEAQRIMRENGAYDIETRRPLESGQGGHHSHTHSHDGGAVIHSHPHTHAAGEHEQHDHSHEGVSEVRR